MAHGGDVGHVAQVDNDVFQVGKGGSAVVEQFFHIEQEATCLRHYVAAVHALAVFVNACSAREKVNALTSHTETGAALEGHAIFIRGIEIVEGLKLTDFSVVQSSAQEVYSHNGFALSGVATDTCRSYIMGIAGQSFAREYIIASSHHVGIVAVDVAHVQPGAQAMVAKVQSHCLEPVAVLLKGGFGLLATV